MSFDPSIISQIPDMAPNPVAAKEQGYKLADMATQQQSNRLGLQQQKQQIQDTEKARNILKGTKLDSPQDVTKAAEKLTNAGLPDEAMKFMKAMQGLQESKGQLSLQQYQLLGAKNDIIGSSVASLVGQADQMLQSGASPALVNAVMQPKYQQAIQQLAQVKLQDGSPALGQQDLQQIQQHPQFDLQFLRTIADRSKQGAAALQAQMKFHADERADKTAGIRAQTEVRMEEDERRKIAADAEKVREDKERDKARLEGIPDKLSVNALETARDIVMVDPTQMSHYASRSPKDPRMGQINEAITAKLKESGMKWQDLERMRQNFKSESKSIDKMTAQLNGIESFEGLARSNGERVLELIGMVDDTSVPLVEGFIRSAKRKAGGIDAGELASVLTTFQAETARILTSSPNMTGVVTDSARKDLQAMAPQSMGKGQAERILRRLFTEMEIRKEQIQRQIGRAQEHSMESAPVAAPPARTPSGALVTPGSSPAPGASAPGPTGSAGPAPASGDFSHLWGGGAPQ